MFALDEHEYHLYSNHLHFDHITPHTFAVEGRLTFEAIPGYLSKSSSCSDMLILYRLCFVFFLTRILRNCRNLFYPLSYSLKADLSEG